MLFFLDIELEDIRAFIIKELHGRQFGEGEGVVWGGVKQVIRTRSYFWKNLTFILHFIP
jgi:hypothetical protein